ncbi:unnamed protein product [Euphydryas editha]|uniref:Uncharacterized protein n=1 Tax=Euphydryas editha TaxID=104508 RepID=A0AAU9VBZ2_EUPED|nr:unnamed protein product [Euphydryas editha]
MEGTRHAVAVVANRKQRRCCSVDVEHTLFECESWRDYRANTEATIGNALNHLSLVSYMLQRKENWRETAAYTQRLLKEKNLREGAVWQQRAQSSLH